MFDTFSVGSIFQTQRRVAFRFASFHPTLYCSSPLATRENLEPITKFDKDMTLDELNSSESNLLAEIEKTCGLIEEKLEQLQQRGVFEKYSKVFEEYSNLIDGEIEGTEALKRAVFLYWYQSAEPSFLSGVDLMPENAGRKVLEKLDDKIKNEDLDYEFQWMLSHYIRIIDFVFSNSPNTRKFSIIENREIWESDKYDLRQFENRGQMGNYWISVISGNLQRLNFKKNLKKK